MEKPICIESEKWIFMFKHVENDQDIVLSNGNITINAYTLRVTIDNRDIRLTPKEFEVLKCLMINAGNIVTNEALLKSVWGKTPVKKDNYVPVSIKQLRRKIETNPRKPQYILTIPSVGYQLCYMKNTA